MPTVKDYVDALNEFLLRTHAVSARTSVLIIDEAQNLSADVLEQLRLLTNLETNERKLLQIILIGQPELRAMLARPELRAARAARDRALPPRGADGGRDRALRPPSPGGGRVAPGRSLRSTRDAAHLSLFARRAAPHQPAVRPRAARRLRGQQAHRRPPHRRQGGRRKCWMPPTSARAGALASSARPSWASGWRSARHWSEWSASR